MRALTGSSYLDKPVDYHPWAPHKARRKELTSEYAVTCDVMLCHMHSSTPQHIHDDDDIYDDDFKM